jgi:hypothetical protein
MEQEIATENPCIFFTGFMLKVLKMTAKVKYMLNLNTQSKKWIESTITYAMKIYFILIEVLVEVIKMFIESRKTMIQGHNPSCTIVKKNLKRMLKTFYKKLYTYSFMELI